MKSTGAEDIRWDLSDLYRHEDEARRDLDSAQAEAEQFRGVWLGSVARLGPEKLRGLLHEFETIQERTARAYSFAFLSWSTNTQDAARGAFLQHVREAHTRIAQQLLFFELEWMQVPDDRARGLMEALPAWRHYLERERLMRDHVLSEPEEKILVEAAVTGSGAWTRYFTETMGAMRFELDGEALPQQLVLSKLHGPDRSVRRRAAEAFTDGLQAHARTLTFVFNTILAEKASRDRLRGFPHWMRSRNLSNEISDEMAEALIAAVTSRYDLVARFYGLKRRLLGLDSLKDYDRYAPVGESERTYEWQEAEAIVRAAYSEFDPRMGEVAGYFFDRRWIDAPVVPGKRGGAFSASTVPGVHPYLLLNYDGRARDVQTLAHELGHGVHQYLARGQGLLQADTPLTTAETASVFGEMLVFHRMMEEEHDPANRLANLVAKIDDTMATVFRQVAMNRFEDRIHRHRRERGELSEADFSEHWMETQESMFQGSVQLGDHYRRWWSYIPHFLHTPGYVYAYAFGELLVLALYARYLEDPERFPSRYLSLLGAGGSDWPHVLVGKLGIDLQDQDFWLQGLGAIEALIVQAETLSA